MDLYLNDILQLTPEELDKSKIEFNMQEGSNGRPFLDKWLNHDEVDKTTGTCNDISYWGWYGKQRNFYPGQWVFSFARMPEDEWLFISAAVVVEMSENARAKVEILEKYMGFFGRLIIKCKKGNTYSRYVFNMRKYCSQAVVKEVLPCLYSGERFEGYDKVHLPYYRLADIFSGKIMPSYYEALKNVTGIYCLTDRHTGKLYIGSATGEEGIKQRWGNYLDSKHGGNKALIDLYNFKGAEYFEKYFTFTLIEYFSLSYDTEKILEREKYWKQCFDTIRNGYNEN